MSNPYLKKNDRYNISTSLFLVFISYVIAVGIGWWSLRLFADWGDLWAVLAADIVATLVIFALGYIWHNASLYDPYWSVIPAFIALYWWSLSDFDPETRKVLLIIAVVAWAVRLTLNWARSWPGFVHEDWRYEMLREKNGALYPVINLSGIHLFPTILVFLGMIPAYFVLTDTHGANLPLDILAFIICMTATMIELIADEQLKTFVAKNTVKGATLKTGLWKYSRHPNYFGEVLFWIGIFVFAVSAGGGQYLWTGIGALAMFLLFWFISIPMMDERMLERRTNYQERIDSTSRFFLWPPNKKN